MQLNTSHQSPNHESRAGRAISMIVVHATVGDLASSLDWLCNPASEVSAHIAIAKSGTAYQLVPFELAAWHAGVSSWKGLGSLDIKRCSIGIELENLTGMRMPDGTVHGPDPYTPAQIATLTAIVRELMSTYSVRMDMLVRHLDIAPDRKTDPACFDWAGFKAALIASATAPAQPDRRVIGVGPSITKEQFQACCKRHSATLSEAEQAFIYDVAVHLDIDPAFVLAVWRREGGSPFGSQPPQTITRNALSVRGCAGDSESAQIDGVYWRSYQTFQLGLLGGLLHLKNYYGSRGLLSVRQIIPVYAPSIENNVEAYIASVLEDMAYMQAH